MSAWGSSLLSSAGCRSHNHGASLMLLEVSHIRPVLPEEHVKHSRKVTAGFLGLVLGVAIAAAAGAQSTEKFKNLQVLPKDISEEQLNSTMNGFTRALGVRCAYCHVGEEGKPLRH